MQEAASNAIPVGGLKAIVEGTYSDPSAKMPLAEAKLNYLKKTLGVDIGYDEAMQLARGADEIAKAVGFQDPAYEKFFNDNMKFLQYAALQNTLYSLGRHEHQKKFTVLVSYGSEIAECDIYIDLYDLSAVRNPQSAITSRIRSRLMDAGRLSFRSSVNDELDFVIL